MSFEVLIDTTRRGKGNDSVGRWELPSWVELVSGYLDCLWGLGN